MARLDLNKAPFFDDFDKSKNFMKVLFRAGTPVQARELNTLQSTLQNQIESFANHVFQNGSKVSNARTNMRPIDYVRLQDNPVTLTGEPYTVLAEETTSVGRYTEGFKLVGETSGVTAILVKAVDIEGDDPATLYVVYSGTGIDGSTTTFIPGEAVSFVDSDGVKVYSVPVRCPACEENTTEMPPLGKGMIFDIDEGIFYFEGMFIQNDRQSILVHKYFSSPNSSFVFTTRPCKIGLDMIQTIVTHIEDESLLDPSLGYPNSTAPGAHRYKVDLLLTKRAYDSSDGENFILLCRIGENANIEYMKSESEYSDIMDMIARRSFETNGNYTIRPFKIRFLEHKKESVNDPNGWSVNGSEGNVVALLSPSVAYVRGYRLEKVDETPVIIPKARSTKKVKGFVTQLPDRSYIVLRPTNGTVYPNPDGVNSEPGLVSRSQVSLIKTVGGVDTVIGTCRVNDIAIESGVVGIDAAYRYYITDLNMIGTAKLSEVTKATAQNGFSALKVGGVGASVQSAKVTVNGSGYTSAPTVTFSAPPSGGVTATGTALISGGEVNTILITNGGSGYNTPPTITISGGGGSNAAAVASLSQSAPFSLFNANSSELVFEVPRQNIKSVRDADDNTTGSIVFTGRRKLTGTLDSQGVVSFSASANQSFLGVSKRTILWVLNGGTRIPIAADSSNYSTTGSGLTINLGPTHQGRPVTVFADVLYTGQREREKALINGSLTTNTAPASWSVGSTSDISLPVADVFSFRVFWVKGGGSVEEITSEYRLETGATDTAYTESKVVRSKSVSRTNTSASDRIRVDYTYFSRRGSGLVYSVDSYPVNTVGESIGYEEIPAVRLTDATTFSAASAIDFRPDVIGTEPINAILPAPDTPVIFDVEYYLPRADLIQINKDGLIYSKSGISSDSPKLPKPDADSMVLYEVWLSAYTYSVKDISNKFIENKRYTMRDIGRLENRIENLEYYTTLNLLEKSAVDMSIKDENGLDRFKNGLIADNFRNFQAADLTSPEFRAGADRTLGELRPQFKSRNHKLRANKNSSSQNIQWHGGNKESTSFDDTGNVATMKYVETVTNFNPFASKHISINPYYVFNKKGNLILSPNNDTWTDERRLPEIITDIDAGVDELKKLSGTYAMGTDWGSWIDQNNTILGKPAEQMETTRFIGPNPATGGLTKTWLTETRPVSSDDAGSGNTGSGNQVGGGGSSNVGNNFGTGNQNPRNRVITVDSRTQSYTINDIVKDVRLIPFMREIDVEFYASKLRPNTRVYAFFNGEDVTANCRPQNLLPTPGAVGFDDFLFGSPLVTNEAGEFTGVFRIPAGRFFVGEKKFKLSNDPSGRSDPDIETTSCESTFFAGGLDITRQDQTLNIITPVIDIKDIVEEPPEDEPVVIIDPPPPPPPPGEETDCDRLIGPSPFDKSCSSCTVSRREGLVGPLGLPRVVVDPPIANGVGLAGGVNEAQAAQSLLDAAASMMPAPGNFRRSNGVIVAGSRQFTAAIGTGDGLTGPAAVWNVTADVLRWVNTCQAETCPGEAPTPCSWCSASGWVMQACWDPVAQSFTLERDSFVTALDIYLKEIDNTSSDVWVELRTMLNGYPTETVLARKEFNLADINSVSSITSENASVPLKVEFDFPVFVKGRTQYCFVVGGYSPNTRIWVARLGQEDVTTPGKLIETPPTQMPSFRSLNGATWNAEQFETIKYNLYVARFQTGEMTIEFNIQNQDEMKYSQLPAVIRNKIRLESWELDNNPIETEAGSNLVRVFVPDHGFTETDVVNISLFDNTTVSYVPNSPSDPPPFIGQPIVFGSEGTGVAIVKSVSPNAGKYTLTVSSTIGDFKMTSGQQTIDVTAPEIRYKPRDGFVFGKMQTLPEFGILNARTGRIERNAFNISTQVGSAYPSLDIAGIPNELVNKDHIVFKVDSQDSFIIQITGAGSSPANATLSGRFGGDNVSIHQFNEKFDVFNVAGSYLAYGAQENWGLTSLYYGPAESPFAPLNNQPTPSIPFIPSEDNFLQQPFKIISTNKDSLKVRAVFTNRDQWVSPVINTDTFSITTISNRVEWIDETDFNTDPNESGRFIEETDPINGSETYKYVTKNVILQDPANELRIFFDVYRDKDSDFDVYVKRQTVYDDLTLDDLPWLPVSIQKTKFSVDLTDRIEYSISCQNQVLETNIGGQTYSWTDENGDPIPFIGFKVKLVGKTRNSCKPPTFRSFRAIAVT